MMRHSFFILPEYVHRKGPSALTAFFLLGHVLGFWFSGHASEAVLSGMHAVVSSRVSLIGLLLTLVLPFLLSAFAVYVTQPILLIPIAFWKAFLFSFLGAGLASVWGSAGWLMTGLVMFSSFCSLPVLYWYWQRHMGGRSFDGRLFWLILALLCLIGMVDFYFIVPFLARIITF